MMNKLIFLAKLGILESFNTKTNKLEIQKIDDPEDYAEGLGLDFTPPTVEYDEDAQEIFNNLTPEQLKEYNSL